MGDTTKPDAAVLALMEEFRMTWVQRENAALRAAVERVRALHDTDWCKTCVVPRPCPTLRALEGTP